MIIDDIRNYIPCCEQEQRDKELILHFIQTNPDAFCRSNTLAHVTASAWIVNPTRTHVLMVYHNIYRSWSWTGGHADGDQDLLGVALRECREETGVTHVRPLINDIYSLEVLNVEGHIKRGKYISSHLHLNITYLLEADDNDSLQICETENSGVRWFTHEDALKNSTEPWFVEWIYPKLTQKLSQLNHS